MMRIGFLLLACFTFSAQASFDYAAWSDTNKDGSWTKAAEYAVAKSPLPRQVPKDIYYFCPTYAKLNQKERKKFWVGLLSAMAKPESNFRPQSYYTEKFTDAKGRRVVSRGLLQISIESANQQRYNCDIPTATLLHDPKVNLSCGVKILSKWVQSDGVIAKAQYAKKVPMPRAQQQASKPTNHFGGSRYWSTLREQHGHLPKIAEFTRTLPFCHKKS